MKFIYKFINNIKKIVNEILKDKVLKYLALGIISSVVFQIAFILIDKLINVKIYSFIIPEVLNYYSLVILSYNIFFISLAGLVIYLPLFKKYSTPKTKEVKILIFDWLLLSIGITTILIANQNPVSFVEIQSLFSVIGIASIVSFLIGIPFFIIYLFIKNHIQRGKIVTTSLTTAIFILLIVAVINYINPIKTTVEVRPHPEIDKTEFRCSTIIGTKLSQQTKKNNLGKVEGELLAKDKMEMYVKIEEKELTIITGRYFLRGQSLEFKQNEINRLILLRNDKEQITAIDTQEKLPNNKGIDTFILNKESAFGIWTKSKPNIHNSNQGPDAQVYYIECFY